MRTERIELARRCKQELQRRPALSQTSLLKRRPLVDPSRHQQETCEQWATAQHRLFKPEDLCRFQLIRRPNEPGQAAGPAAETQ
jgi:hypothetical protein